MKLLGAYNCNMFFGTKNKQLALVLVLLILSLRKSNQHGFLIDPPSRSSAWLVDKDFEVCCVEYNHNQMFCGGLTKLW